MTLQALYTTIKKHLISEYNYSSSVVDNNNFNNLVACRALALTRLYLVIRQYQEECSALNLTSAEAIIHLLYCDEKLPLSGLNQLPASLVLKILDPRISALDLSSFPDFQRTSAAMVQWIEENREWIAQSHEAGEGLPELQWSALPSELFSGMTEK